MAVVLRDSGDCCLKSGYQPMVRESDPSGTCQYLKTILKTCILFKYFRKRLEIVPI